MTLETMSMHVDILWMLMNVECKQSTSSYIVTQHDLISHLSRLEMFSFIKSFWDKGFNIKKYKYAVSVLSREKIYFHSKSNYCLESRQNDIRRLTIIISSQPGGTRAWFWWARQLSVVYTCLRLHFILS